LFEVPEIIIRRKLYGKRTYSATIARLNDNKKTVLK
jgi:hypothetical protein